jgi:hypothetical protein
VKEAREVQEVKERTGVRKPTWVAIWAVAIFVTSIGGNPETANWKPGIQLPGSFVVLYFGWFIGPFGTIMSPFVVGILTILTNVLAYYVLVKMILFVRGKLKAVR